MFATTALAASVAFARGEEPTPGADSPAESPLESSAPASVASPAPPVAVSDQAKSAPIVGEGAQVAVIAAPLAANPPSAPALEPAAISFSKDIAPIFQRACQTCHRPGQVAPMSLLTYQEARPWARAIRKAVAEREMPPWGSDSPREFFVNDPCLSPEQIELVTHWVDSGAPEGDPGDAPPPLAFQEGWTLGAPDLVLSMPRAYAIAAETEDKFVYFELATGLTEDKWLASIEVRPGNPRAVHHAMAYALQAEDADQEISRLLGRHANLLTEYAPGNNGDAFPPDAGRLLMAGAHILVQIHYHAYGVAGADQTSIGLRFHKSGDGLRRVVSRPVLNFDLVIPPGAGDHRHEAEITLDRPANIISFQPHMHFRGKAMLLEAISPDGSVATLCNVPKYNPYWQITYSYRQPPLLPAGTRLRVTSWFDNSAANSLNPDSTAEVRWGPQAFDEMAIGWLDLIYETPQG